MEYRPIDGIQKKVSRIVIGTMKLSAMDYEDCCALLDAVFAMGCTVLDTAHVYGQGESERKIGKWMERRGNREQVVLLTKGAHPSSDRRRVTHFDILSDISDSLARLRTDYADIYLLHRDDCSVPVGPIVETLNKLRDEGKIKVFGGSNWTYRRIQEANEYAYAHGLAGFSVSSPYYGLAEQADEPWPECYGISGAGGAGDRAWYQKNRMPVFAYSCLGRGFFSGKITRENFELTKDTLDAASLKAYPSEANFTRLDRAYALAAEKGLTVTQIAMAYLLNQPENVYPVIGISRADRLTPLAAMLGCRLTEKELMWLDLRADER
ncbi:MAG: aldo/keto reductase [Christensenellales bacterium]